MRFPGTLTQLSLTDGWVHWALITGALLSLAGLVLLGRDRAWWTRRIPLAVAGVAAVVALSWGIAEHTKSWPDGFPSDVLIWAAVGLLGPVLLALGWRRHRLPVRALSAVAAALVLLGAADAIDAVYGAFPTVATALQLPPTDTVSGLRLLQSGPADPVRPAGPLWQTWRPPGDLPARGEVAQVSIPGTRSGFSARPAWVYVPPAYLVVDHPALPVLELIGGQPGSPRDWVDAGQVVQHLDAWAAAHRGLAPIVVMPDATGGETANTLCMDSALGRADTYLARDVPAWIAGTLHPDPDRAHWAVGGFSFGGTCALQLAVAHPDLFRTFFDASGQQAPTLGNHVRTVGAAFPADPGAWPAVDPLTELRRHRYGGSAGWFVVGADDPFYLRQQHVVTAAAAAAGMSIVARELPGRHSWAIPRTGLVNALPWLAVRMGLTP